MAIDISGSGIYEIRCIPIDQRYVGSAAVLKRRWIHHRWLLRKGRHHCKKLQVTWSQFGEAAFEYVAIESCEKSLLKAREKEILDFHLGHGWQLLNTSTQASGASEVSVEVREKISVAKKGKKFSPEHCANIGKSKTGVVQSAESNARRSEANKGRVPWNSGKRLSEGHKANISKGLTGGTRSPEAAAKTGAALRGRRFSHTPEAKAKKSETSLRVWAQRKAIKALLDAA